MKREHYVFPFFFFFYESDSFRRGHAPSGPRRSLRRSAVLRGFSSPDAYPKHITSLNGTYSMSRRTDAVLAVLRTLRPRLLSV